MRLGVIILMGALAACTEPGAAEDALYQGGHRFVVAGSFGAESATLTLNGVETEMERDGTTFTASSDVGDASGRIEIIYNGDGMQVICPIDYITSGEAEPHRYTVERGECSEEGR